MCELYDENKYIPSILAGLWPLYPPFARLGDRTHSTRLPFKKVNSARAARHKKSDDNNWANEESD